MNNIYILQIKLSILKSAFWVLVFMLVYTELAYGQSEMILNFENITVRQGLPSNTIYCMIQDHNGFMWFGTKNGLCRYDGYDFVDFFSNPNDSNSLNNNDVKALYEDEKGYIWIGTTGGGLNRFDPVTEKFTHYMHNGNKPKSIIGNDIRSICKASEGGIWIATYLGLSKLLFNSTLGTDKENLEFINYTHDPNDKFSLPDNETYTVYEAKNGVLWTNGNNVGLVKFNPKEGKFYNYTDKDNRAVTIGSNYVMSIYEDKNGMLWTPLWAGGISMFNPENETFTTYKNDPNDPNSISMDYTYSVAEDDFGNIWVGTYGNGLLLMARNKETGKIRFTPFRNDPHNPNSLADDRIKLIYRDKAGFFWVATLENGLSKVYLSRNVFDMLEVKDNNTGATDDDLYENKNFSAVTRAICEDKNNNLWLGTNNGLVFYNKTDKKTKRFVHLENDLNSLDNDNVKAIIEDDFGNIWVSTDSGINKLNKTPESYTIQHFAHEGITKIRYSKLIESNKNIFLCSSEGFFEAKLDTKNKTLDFIKLDIEPDTVFHAVKECISIVEDADTIWVGTRFNGLFKIFPKEGSNKLQLQKYEYDPLNQLTISSNFVSTISVDKSGNLWVGTNYGLNKLNRSIGTFTRFTQKDGLAGDVIAGMLSDKEGNYWIATDRGLTKFNPDKRVFKIYDRSTGLPVEKFIQFSASVSYQKTIGSLKSKTGEIFFGINKGFLFFRPDELKENENIPNIRFTGFKIASEKINPGEYYNGRLILTKSIGETKSIVLNYNEKNFSLDFAALDLTSPSNNRYEYRIEGIDEKGQWNPLGNRNSISFHGLENGDYTLIVRASNNSGVWNKKGISMQITIQPPWWGTLWFKIISSLFVIVGIIVLTLLRTRSLKRTQKMLEAKVKEATDELESRNIKLLDAKSKLSSIIDDVKTQLSKTSLELLDANNNQAVSIEEISSSIEMMTEDINDNAVGSSKMSDNAKIIEENVEISVEIVSKTVVFIENIIKEIGFISEFAKMTNLLSLNAAIEAARAGIHGRSFSEVAKQVKKLAVQSSDAAIKIKKLSESGLDLSHEANIKIIELQKFIKTIVALIAKINNASQNQSVEANTINTGVQQISSSVNITAQLAQQLDDAIKSLSV